MHIRVSLWLAFLPPFPLLGQLLAGCKIWNTFWKTSFLGSRFFTPLDGWRNNLGIGILGECMNFLVCYSFTYKVSETEIKVTDKKLGTRIICSTTETQ